MTRWRSWAAKKLTPTPTAYSFPVPLGFLTLEIPIQKLGILLRHESVPLGAPFPPSSMTFITN